MSAQSLNDILNEADLPVDKADFLLAKLYAREDAMVEVMQLAGVQFGLFAEIVAEVLAEVGIGTPMSEEQRALVRANFQSLMVRLQEEHGLNE